MKTLILHPTEISQWHALVNEAQVSTQFVLNERIESYLVFLLMRFSQETTLLESVLAYDFLKSKHLTKHRQVTSLREIGDKSLLFCGLFPGIAKRRHLNVTYFSDLGQAAYLTISELNQLDSTKLFFQLSAQFLNLQQILQAMRNKYLNDSNAITLCMAQSAVLLQ